MYTRRSSRPAIGPLGMSSLVWLAPMLGAILAGRTFAWITGETHADTGMDRCTEDGHTAAFDSMGRSRLDR